MGNWKIVVPRNTTNLIKNPSFETGTTSWTTGGGNTIAQTDDFANFGRYCLKVTHGGTSNLLASYPNITLPASGQYQISAWARIANTWDGGDVRIKTALFTSSSESIITEWLSASSAKGQWIRLHTLFIADAGDLTGDIEIRSSSLATSGALVFVDAVQLEQFAVLSTYVDGDQEGCSWSGTPHASISSRTINSRAGGAIRDLEDYYGLYVSNQAGLGMPPVHNVAVGRALLDGQEHQRAIAQPANIQLSSTVLGTSLTDWHAQRQLIVNDFAPLVANDQPFILRYTGSEIEKEIQARYVGGLDMNKPGGTFSEVMAIRLVADNPFFYQIGNSVVKLDTKDAASIAYAVVRDSDTSPIWDNLGPATGTPSEIDVVRKVAERLYVGGGFTNLNGIADADNVAYYDFDSSSWSALATAGANSFVTDIIKAPDGGVYVGGWYTTFGGVTCRGVAHYLGSTVTALGPPSSGGNVYALALSATGNLFVGGSFTNWDGIANADNFVMWNGSSWSAIGTGMNGAVRGLAVDTATGYIYAVGEFTQAGGTSANRAAYWNGSGWQAMGSGLNGTARHCFISEGGTLYVGGDFTTAGGATVNRIAKWNGTAWFPLADGIDNGAVWRVRPDTVGGLYASGSFTAVGGIALFDRLAYWNGSMWVHLDIDLPGSGVAAGLDWEDGVLYIGPLSTGTANFAGDTTVTNLGTARAYPTIEVEWVSGGTSARLTSIRNESTGAKLWFDYQLVKGEKLTIDLTPTNRSMVSSLHGKRWRVLPNSDVATFYLQPGNNNISIFVVDGGGPTLAAHIKWRNSYWGVD